MNAGGVRFACVGDVHIGRVSSGAPEETALAAFGRVVDRVVEAGADGVLIAGDLFDTRAAQYSARRELVAQLRRLRQRGIPVLAVAGNHDAEALRDFQRSVPELLRVLGERAWEEVEVAGVRVLGRSFERSHASDLAGSLRVGTDSRPVVGLMHADVDAVSPYNAVRLEALRGLGVGAWVLGHVHEPRVWADPLAAYVGSPQALDAGEPGVHGFRWLEWDGVGFGFSEVVPISSVRYETLTVTSEGGAPVEACIEEALAGEDAAGARWMLRVHVRVLDEMPHVPEGVVEEEGMTWEVRGVERCPRVDLAAEAEQADARGQAARLLLGLEGRGGETAEAMAEALVADLLADLAERREKMKIPGGEAFDVLRGTPEADRAAAVQAVRAALGRVLTAGRVEA